MTIQYEYDTHHIFTADIVRIDQTFDDEFGSQKQFDYVVENFHVTTYMNNIDYDITSAFNPGQLKFFKSWMLERFLGESAA